MQINNIGLQFHIPAGKYIQLSHEFMNTYNSVSVLQIFISTFKHFDLLNKIPNLIIHANIDTSIWDTKEKKPNIRGINYLKFQINEGIKSGHKIAGFVIHLPLCPVNTIADIICGISVKTKGKMKLLLEMPSRKCPNCDFNTPRSLAALISSIKLPHSKVGICIDTAHLWAMNIDIRSYANTKKWLDEFAKLVSAKYIGLIHLNGSSIDINSGYDVHQIPFSPADKIWHKIPYSDSGVKAFVEFARKNKIFIILENNRGTLNDYHEFIKKLSNAKN
jgi:hypothetical protein